MLLSSKFKNARNYLKRDLFHTLIPKILLHKMWIQFANSVEVWSGS